MDAQTIIARQMNTEGFRVSKKALVHMALQRIRSGYDQAFQYNGVVFTVTRWPGEPYIHIYSKNGGKGFLTYCRQFMHDVWEETDHDYLLALIRNPRVMKLAQRFGWKDIGIHSSGARVYSCERPK